MAALTTYLSDNLLDCAVRNVAYTPPAAVYCALFTTPTNPAGGGTEVVGGGSGYVRQAITFGTPAAAQAVSNTVAITFPMAVTGWGTITHAAVMDGGGNMLFEGPIAAPKTIGAGETFVIPIGALTLTLV